MTQLSLDIYGPHAPRASPDSIEIIIDGNCGDVPTPRKRNALPPEEQQLIERIKTGDATAWNDYDVVVVAFSGGKDSLAAILQLLEFGCPHDKLKLWHHEIDGREDIAAFMDWPVTPSYCRVIAKELRLPLRFSWKEGGFRREMLRDQAATAPTAFDCEDGEVRRAGGMGKPGTRLRWPAIQADLKVRWCSAYLKIDVAAAVFRNDPRFKPGGRFMLVTGERREESSSRAKYAEAEMHRSCNKKRAVVQWRSVIDWTEHQVWEIIQRHGIVPHPCYRAGFGRCSCAFCIFGNADQFAAGRELLPEQFRRLVEVEEALGFTMQRKIDLVGHADNGSSFSREVPEAVKAACRACEYGGAVRTDEWALPAGAFKAQGGPV